MIESPTQCPSCQSTLVLVTDTLYCRNTACPAQSAKQVEHFAKTLKIKGLGPATIDKLMIESILEIYDLKVEYATKLLGSERLAIKLLDEIERSKQEPLNTVLPAFGISLIGKTATEKLSKVCDSIFDIDEAICKKAGLGPVATNNLMTWLNSDFDYYCDLPFSFEFVKTASVTESRGIVCISGKLNSFKTKAEAAEILKNKGFVVKDSLTKDVTILVNESGIQSAKTEKANTLGISIVTNLKDYLENI